MSEYRRQIAAGATVAVVVALVLALGVGAFFPQLATSGTISSTTTGLLPSSSSPPSTATETVTVTSTSGAPTTSTATTTTTFTSTTSISTTSTVTYSTTTTISSTTTTSATTTTATSTTQCDNCGLLQIASANLTVGASDGRTILSLTIVNGGSGGATDLQVSFGLETSSAPQTVLVVIPALAAGTQTWLSIQVPSTQPVTAGQSYRVTANCDYANVNYVVVADVTVIATG